MILILKGLTKRQAQEAVKSLYGRKWKDADYEIKPEPEDEQNDSDTANPV